MTWLTQTSAHCRGCDFIAPKKFMKCKFWKGRAVVVGDNEFCFIVRV